MRFHLLAAPWLSLAGRAQGVLGQGQIVVAQATGREARELRGEAGQALEKWVCRQGLKARAAGQGGAVERRGNRRNRRCSTGTVARSSACSCLKKSAIE